MKKCELCKKEIKDNGLMFCSNCRKEVAEKLDISIRTARNYERLITFERVSAPNTAAQL